MQRIWVDIVGYEGIYKISNDGLIKKKEKLMKTRVLRGYETIGLTKNGVQKTKPVHRLVAEAFIPNNENKKEVNHIDGDKLNNNTNNLEWVTTSENSLHAFKLGLRKVSDGGRSKKVKQICPNTNKTICVYPSLRYIEKNTSFLRKEISLACRGNYLYKNYYWKFI